MKCRIFFICKVLFLYYATSSRVRAHDCVGSFTLNKYNCYENIEDFLCETTTNFPKNTELEEIGTTFENRPLYLLKIFEQSAMEKPVIFIDANIHAREWVTNAIALNLINELLHSNDLLQNIDWYIIPMINPDGYTFSRSSEDNRYWRKNRSKSPDSKCSGVDLNRNFPYHWGESGVSENRCHPEIYAGPKPLSEFESIALSEVLNKYANRIVLYLSLHAFGERIVYPYGYAVNRLPMQWRDLEFLGKILANAMKSVHGTEYNVSNSASWYPAAGGSDDYAMGVVNIPLVLVVEYTNDDFVYPESKLRLIYDESMAGFRAVADAVSKIFKPKKKYFSKYLTNN